MHIWIVANFETTTLLQHKKNNYIEFMVIVKKKSALKLIKSPDLPEQCAEAGKKLVFNH